ncbi:MAG: HAD family hydrolase [Clostridiales Family XIII bacterium]|jgi:HAD superfamily hydrolase (TIGR01549 family)|nr:HAD family hydrolase [Clostridiales Family XIII bacterium]
MYKHVVFDIDGTILDTDYAQLSTCSKIVEMSTGIYRPPEMYAHILGILNDEHILASLGVRDADLYAMMWDDICEGLSAEVRAFDGILTTIDALAKDGKKIGIVTSRHRKYLSSDNDGIFERQPFGTVICGDEVINPKPSPEPLNKYVAMNGIATRDVLYIGDSVMDYYCAKESGCDFGCVDWGKRKPDDAIDKAAFYFKHPSEIPVALGLTDKKQ